MKKLPLLFAVSGSVFAESSFRLEELDLTRGAV
jgi:hypothetical protein